MNTWRRYGRPLAVLVVLSATALLLLTAGPRVGLLVALARHPQRAVDAGGADSAAMALAGGAAWLVLGWLVMALGLTAAATIPGGTGRVARSVANVAVPRTLRRLTALALGLSLVTGAGVATAAVAEPGSPGTRGPAAALDLDWPTTPAPGAQPPAPSPVRGQPTVVEVAPGDSLWSIAARSLPPGSGAAQVAAEWPRWYAANRALIGPDPALIRPGQQLSVPVPRRSP